MLVCMAGHGKPCRKPASAVGAVLLWWALVATPFSAGADDAQQADGGLDRQPRVRVEVWGGNTFDGRGHWLHDGYVAHAVELEWSLFSHLSMGLRAVPILIYFDAPLVAGTALGMTHRLYWTPDASGLYVGPAIALLGHYGRFKGNSANLNFMSSVEIGYQLQQVPLRVGFKLEHVSNAGLARHNQGWNGISLLVGTTAWP